MRMGHLLHYIGADTAGLSACFPVIVYNRLATDIYKYLVICSAICVTLLNCHYFGGNWTQPVINWKLLSWGGSCLFINAAFTLQINHRQITINYYSAVLSLVGFSLIETQEIWKHYFFIISGDTVIKNDLKSWPMSDWTHTHYAVCVCAVLLCACVCVGFRHGRNNRPRSGEHQAKAYGFFLVLEWEEWAPSCVSTLPRNLKHKLQPADSRVSCSTHQHLLLSTWNTRWMCFSESKQLR